MAVLTSAPMNSPTNGNHAEDRENSTGEKSRTTGTGTRVKNCIARRRPRNFMTSRRFAVDSGGTKRRHVPVQCQGGPNDGQRECRAAALAEAHPEINQRLQSQRPKRIAVAAFGRSI